LIQNELKKENILVPKLIFGQINELTPETIRTELFSELKLHLAKLDDYYSREFVMANTQRENMIMYYMEQKPGLYNLIKDMYHNESVEEHVRKVFEKNKMVEYRNEIIQQTDPIYKDPVPENWFSFRSHFLAPRKYFMGSYIETYWFNMGIIWFMTVIFFIILFFDLLKKLLRIINFVSY
jgi:hypothetical protein